MPNLTTYITLKEESKKMKLTLVRTYNTSRYCIGHLYINGKFFCDTLEDTDRMLDDRMTAKEIQAIKVKGKTAIPTGVYKITMRVVSPRLSKKSAYRFCGGRVPRLISVKAYDGVLIHIGNKAEDTDGCVLVGENKVKGQVINSTDTFRRLYPIMEKASVANEDIWIEIKRKY